MQLDLLSKKNILFLLSFFEKHDFLKRYLVRKKMLYSFIFVQDSLYNA